MSDQVHIVCPVTIPFLPPPPLVGGTVKMCAPEMNTPVTRTYTEFIHLSCAEEGRKSEVKRVLVLDGQHVMTGV